MNRIPGRPIRWGILSCGRIASDYAKAIAWTPGSEVVAVAARSADRADEFASRHGISKSYGSYHELLRDPNVDVVYVASVADYHYPLATMALQAGKATVVEKPLTTNYKATSDLIQLARQQNTFLMEGMWTRCFPSVRHVQRLIQEGAIGDPVMVQADFGWLTANCGPEERVWFPESGGLILDVGTYMAQWSQVAFGSKTQVEKIQAMGTTKHGVDHTVLTNIQYHVVNRNGGAGKGFLQFYLTGRANTEERVVIQGTSGRILVEPPFHIPQRIRLVKDHGRGCSSEEVFDFPQPDDSFTSWNYPGSIGFTHQIQAVEQALLHGQTECPYFPLDDSLQVASILDNLRREILAQGLDEGADLR